MRNLQDLLMRTLLITIPGRLQKLLRKSSTDVKTTLRAVSSALTTLDAELSATPRDADLYCSYTVVFYIATFSKSCLVLLPCIN